MTSTLREELFAGPRERASAARALARIFQQEDVNFLVTNRIPRRYLTLLLGWFSHIESPRLTRASIAVWQLFGGDLGLHEAKHARFNTLRECFIRELRDGARPVNPDPEVLVSPCDAEVGALGRVKDGSVFQAKGFPYTLGDLLGDVGLAERHHGAAFVTLRLRSSMYHRFHAPADASVSRVRHLSGDTWNVNPIALRRVERLFCKNERAVVELRTNEPDHAVTLVAIASILVASIRVHAADRLFDLRYAGPSVVDCGDRPVRKGEELGYFESGSTIVMLVNGPFAFADGVKEGSTLRVGQALLRRTRQDNREEG